jgi:hypothetical protein
MLDSRIVRDVIRHWDVRVADQAALAEVVIAANRRGGRRLAAHRESLVDLLDPTFVAELERVIDTGLELTGRGRGFLTALIGERVRPRAVHRPDLHRARGVPAPRQPALGGWQCAARRSDQASSASSCRCCRKQAVAFALDRANQRAVLDLTRAVARHLLAMPIRATRRRWPSRASAVRGAAARGRDQSAPHRSRPARYLAAWDDVFANVKNRKIGDLLRVEGTPTGWPIGASRCCCRC